MVSFTLSERFQGFHLVGENNASKFFTHLQYLQCFIRNAYCSIFLLFELRFDKVTLMNIDKKGLDIRIFVQKLEKYCCINKEWV